ncbi:MAG: alpha/beta hydrolase, partial [Bacteroidales bacterium]
MKKIFFLLFCFTSLISGKVKAQYVQDELGGKFEKQTIAMPDDYEGNVVCSLIKSPHDIPSTKAVLYIHGFNDYFFQ